METQSLTAYRRSPSTEIMSIDESPSICPRDEMRQLKTDIMIKRARVKQLEERMQGCLTVGYAVGIVISTILASVGILTRPFSEPATIGLSLLVSVASLLGIVYCNNRLSADRLRAWHDEICEIRVRMKASTLRFAFLVGPHTDDEMIDFFLSVRPGLWADGWTMPLERRAQLLKHVRELRMQLARFTEATTP